MSEDPILTQLLLNHYRLVHNGAVVKEANHIVEAGNEFQIDAKSNCVLWDKTCTGNRSAALVQFFESTAGILLVDPCFTAEISGAYTCKSTSRPSSQLALTSTVKSWMRSPACKSALQEEQRILGKAVQTQWGCCGSFGCQVGGPNVGMRAPYTFYPAFLTCAVNSPLSFLLTRCRRLLLA